MQHDQSEWKKEYLDDHDRIPILKVDSHQLTRGFQLGHRYDSPTPCRTLVAANQWADNVAKFGLGRLRLSKDQLESPLVKSVGKVMHLGGMRFYFSLHGKTCDHSVTKNVWQAIDKELQVRAQTKARQGAMFRASGYVLRALRAVPFKGPRWRLLLGLGNAHT